jgi:ATP-dependent DNA helicase RecG
MSLFYDDYFELVDKIPENFSKEDIVSALEKFAATYDPSWDNNTWFENVKAISEQIGYAPDVKLYKSNPDAFRGHVGDVSMFLRVAVTGKLRERAYNFIKQHLADGRQAYIVCPMIEEGAMELQAAAAYAENIGKNAFSDYRIGLLHGKLSPKEKEDVMNAFKNHETDLLVCTTVVEVGIDVPNAAVMLIEDAERFGLSQLHQLRGRVGRGKHKSYCILMTEHVTEESKQRLRTLSSTSDGFKIAEEDLKMRGPGDFFGQRQHGLPPLKIADLTKDMKLFEETKALAARLLREDPDLMQPYHRPLRLEVLRLFAKAGDNGMN